jgi:endonuclease YncB( thermonuclease family)
LATSMRFFAPAMVAANACTEFAALAGGAEDSFDSNPERPLVIHLFPCWIAAHLKRMVKALKRFVLLLASIFFTLDAASGKPLATLEGCKLLPTEWTDGDSFLIQTSNGVQHTLRLYGADCIEWHVTDESDARRLRAQRRYFGISEAGGSPQSSIEIAKGFGKSAAEETASILKKPFTVHTAFSDARGEGKHKRIYGFVTTSDGQDLSERLVQLGLARAFGVSELLTSVKRE